MTPEARLAAAMKGVHVTLFGHRNAKFNDAWYDRLAAAILSADPTLAADLALAAAVRRLPEYMAIERYNGEWHVSDNTRQGICIAHDPTLTVAIDEATLALYRAALGGSE